MTGQGPLSQRKRSSCLKKEVKWLFVRVFSFFAYLSSYFKNTFLFMLLSVGHYHKADPIGLQSRVKMI